MPKLSHTDQEGRACMVDVSPKPDQLRTATASGHIALEDTTLKLIRENLMKKGDVMAVAEVAGIQAAKQTAALIPLCHPLMLTRVSVKCKIESGGIGATAEVKCTGPTGVEMEALTAVSVALLTIYDMCKAVDKNMIISEVRLVEKTKASVSEKKNVRKSDKSKK